MPRIDSATSSGCARKRHCRQAGSAGGPPRFVLREAEVGRGFALLPAPAHGNLFFDIEGDPYDEAASKTSSCTRGATAFKAWRAHDAAKEADAVASVLDFMVAHLRAHAGAHEDHYNRYETTPSAANAASRSLEVDPAESSAAR